MKRIGRLKWSKRSGGSFNFSARNLYKRIMKTLYKTLNKQVPIRVLIEALPPGVIVNRLFIVAVTDRDIINEAAVITGVGQELRTIPDYDKTSQYGMVKVTEHHHITQGDRVIINTYLTRENLIYLPNDRHFIAKYALMNTEDGGESIYPAGQNTTILNIPRIAVVPRTTLFEKEGLIFKSTQALSVSDQRVITKSFRRRVRGKFTTPSFLSITAVYRIHNSTEQPKTVDIRSLYTIRYEECTT